MALSAGSDTSIFPLLFWSAVVEERLGEGAELHRHRDFIIRAVVDGGAKLGS